MNTSDLIERLGTTLAPVQPLRRPGARAARWLLVAAVYVAILAVSMLEPSANTVDARLVLPQLAALATGTLAAIAALSSVVPGHPKHVLVWPWVAGIIWIGTLLAGVPGDGSATALVAHDEWLCVALIVLGGAPPLAVLAVMLRRGAPLNPVLTAALAALAAGTLANVSACVSQPHASNAVTLVWHGGAIVALVLGCVLGARWLFTWSAARKIAPL